MSILQEPFAGAEMLIRKPVSQVFEAFVNPAVTKYFWFTGSSGRLEQGQEVTWRWEMYDLEEKVRVLAVIPDQLLTIEWGSGEQQSVVTWNFASHGPEATFVSIRNSGLRGQAPELIDQVRNLTEGFVLVLAGAKAWLEHGLELGLVRDRHPKGLSAAN